ncbi:MAG: PQQ-binding-like beta-propeller repeat protein [Candidatus Bathyarchaeia archaeon]|jgi:hypothetical protein
MNFLHKAIALFAAVFMVVSIFALPIPANSQPTGSSWQTAPPSNVTPDVIVEVEPYLSFRPNPIGVGQQLLINFWATPPPAANRYLSNFYLTITKPDGTTEEFGPINSYVADGTAWLEYTPEQTGTYKLKFEFKGTYFPAGVYINGYLNGTDMPTGYGGTSSTYGSTWFKPASTAEQELTVQQDFVSSWPASQMPTGYWTRPISPENREWWSIAGNYPWAYYNDARDYLGPFVIAPSTAHVAWKMPVGLAGIIGGETEDFSLGTREFLDPGVILMGRLYMTNSKAGVGNVAGCYDLRTGEVIYEKPLAEGGVTPYIISYVEGTSAVPGAIPSLTPELIAADRAGLYGRVTLGSRLIKIDPWTGAVTLNATGMTGYFHNNQYVLSVQNLGTNISEANRYRLINWTTAGSSTNFTTRIISNTSFPISNLPSLVDYERGVAVQVNRFAAGGVYGGNIFAINLKDGKVLWNITTDPETPFSSGCASIDDGKIAVVMEDRSWYCYDLYSGNLAWKTEQLGYPWDVFWSYDASSWNGTIYAGEYSGVYAINWADGNVQWKFESTSVPFETPYNGYYSFHAATIVADGKLYTYSSEHTPSQPITRGWNFFCLNASTGEEIWDFAGSGTDSRRFRGCAADGYLTVSSVYDGMMYVFGKGQSITTADASPKVSALGTSVLIEGSVLDQSPGQPNTPCVSKDSMSVYMEYIHKQMPIAGIWGNETLTGIPVSLDAVDPNGNNIHIADVTTDGYSGSFGYVWEPETTGQYTITATFMGDDSYGGSFATTYVGIVDAQATTTPTSTSVQAAPDSIPYIIGTGVAIIIALAIVGLLILRKKP